jgi:hypothetical protein
VAQWFKRHGADGGESAWRSAITEDGVQIRAGRGDAPISSPDAKDLLHQFEDEGFALPVEGGWQLSWDSLPSPGIRPMRGHCPS